MAGDTPPDNHDGYTLTEMPTPASTRSKRTLGVVGAAIALLAVAAVVWLLRPSPDELASVVSESKASANGQMVPSPAVSPSPEVIAPSPSGVTPQPSGLPTRGQITTIRPASTVATCDGTPGFDSEGNTVALDSSALTDGRSDTAWRCTYREADNELRWDPARNTAVGESVTFYFPQPVEVEGARLLPGYTKIDPYDQANRYAANGRPLLVEWRFGDSSVVRQELRPKPPSSRPQCKVSGGSCVLGAGWWSDEVRNPNPSTPITSLTLTILDIQPGNDAQLANSAAISEVEILGYL